MTDALSDDDAGRGSFSAANADDHTEIKARVRNVVKDQPTRPDPRSERTVEYILQATFKLLREGGSEKLTIRSVCNEAEISRGTFYRYFESKEDLMDSATRYLRDQTDAGVYASVEGLEDPIERFQKFLDFALDNPGTRSSSRLLDTEPEFILRYFRENFSHFKNRLSRALEPVYDSWESELEAKIDRELVSELFVRFALSATLVPIDRDRKNMAQELRRLARLIRTAPKKK